MLGIQIMVASTTAFIAAGRFGLAPTVNRTTSAGLKFQEVNGGVKSGDPSGVMSTPQELFLEVASCTFDAAVAACFSLSTLF
jgi:hypothetical protein